MERCDVMAWTEPHGAPDNRDTLLAEQIARVLQVDEVLQLECDVMHLDVITSDEIYRVMICVAAHEHKEIIDPIRNAEAQYPLVELGRLLWIVNYEGDVPEFQRTDAEMTQMLAEVIPFLEKCDRGVLVVLKHQSRAHPGNRIVA